MLLPRSQHPTTRRQDRSSLGSEASSLGSNLVFDQSVADGWSWACMGPLRPDLAPTDSFVRNGSSVSSRSRTYVCGSQEVRSS
jgi:hypothetical protein